MKYNKIIVTGPEGCGTTVLSDLLAEIMEWTRVDPPGLQIPFPSALPPEYVYHISLPSHRPAIWSPLDLAVKKDPKLAVFGILRDPADAVHSVRRRFGGMKLSHDDPGPPSVEDLLWNYLRAREITEKVSLIVINYGLLCYNPDGHVRMLCSSLGVPPAIYKKMRTTLVKRSKAWADDPDFIRELIVHNQLVHRARE